MLRLAIFSILFCLVLASVFITAQPARGEERGKNLALVIVSGHGGYTSQELNKAAAFRRYLLDNGFQDEDVRYLTAQYETGSQGEADVSNVIGSFEWLKNGSMMDSRVVIYIADHEQMIDGVIHFQFNDGTISAEQMDDWVDEMEFSSVDMILNGPRSGMAGTDLSGDGRAVFCSMKGYQRYDPDLFNITRSLMDTKSDKDHDGEVTYLEAFEMERQRLMGTGQEPVRY